MKIIERWKKSLYRKAVKHRLIAPQVIVLMDGGVCSQMHQYLLGRIFENGYDRYAKDYFLEMEIKPIIQNNRLKVNDEDYMGATAWSIWKDGLRITEVFCSEDFSKTENLYFYITDNFK